MIISGSIHVAADGIISFFFMAEYVYSIVYMYHIIFIHFFLAEGVARFYTVSIIENFERCRNV